MKVDIKGKLNLMLEILNYIQHTRCLLNYLLGGITWLSNQHRTTHVNTQSITSTLKIACDAK